MKKLTRNLKVELSDDEKLNLMRQMVEITAERSEAEGKLASVSAEYKGTIKSKNAEHDRIAQLVHQGWDYREVEVEEQRDERMKEIVVYRVDTWAEVHRRTMNPEERQLSLKFDALTEPSKNESPEESAKNAKAFLKKKGDVAENLASNEGEKEATDDDCPGGHENDEPEPASDIEQGESFPKNQVKEVKIKFDKDLDFGAVIKVAQDEGDGFHFGYRISSSRMPKYAHPKPVFVDSDPYEDYNEMLQVAADAMIERLNTDPKFQTMTIERRAKITETIEAFCGEELTQAVSGD